MPKIAYDHITINPKHRAVIDQANAILDDYAAQGFRLTLRQLYYQFVARALIANKQSEYKRLGEIVANGRLAGLIDWNHIEDRTRNLRSLSTWDDPSDIVSACAAQFKLDVWSDQDTRIEVWIEKDALIGVIEPICNRLRLPYFSCRGYTSMSEMWGAAQRIIGHYQSSHQGVVIFHLGDHDPSGLDMTRDIDERLAMFTNRHGAPRPEVRRLALNMDQIDRYQPPPNPAKTTDTRYQRYQEEHGDESWELDALEPSVIARLIEDEADAFVDAAKMLDMRTQEREHRDRLSKVSDRWDEVVEFVEAVDDGE